MRFLQELNFGISTFSLYIIVPKLWKNQLRTKRTHCILWDLFKIHRTPKHIFIAQSSYIHHLLCQFEITVHVCPQNYNKLLWSKDFPEGIYSKRSNYGNLMTIFITKYHTHDFFSRQPKAFSLSSTVILICIIAILVSR